MFGAEPLRHLQLELPGRDSVKAVVTADHPIVAVIHADLVAREALAELGADGMLIAAGAAAFRGTAEVALTYRLPGYESGLRLRVDGPAVLSDVVRLPHRLRQQGLWGVESDIFIADLACLGLDPRIERSLREAVESYRRGVFLAASSLLGAAVEGAWYAAGQRLRSVAPRVNQLVDSRAVTSSLSTGQLVQIEVLDRMPCVRLGTAHPPTDRGHQPVRHRPGRYQRNGRNGALGHDRSVMDQRGADRRGRTSRQDPDRGRGPVSRTARTRGADDPDRTRGVRVARGAAARPLCCADSAPRPP